MDKTLEIVMVAVALVVAVVIVTGILQGSADGFGNFADSQTDSSDCSIKQTQLENSVVCDGSGSWSGNAERIVDNNGQCNFPSKSSLCP